MDRAGRGSSYHLGCALGARDRRNRVSWLSAHLLDFPAHEAYRKERRKERRKKLLKELEKEPGKKLLKELEKELEKEPGKELEKRLEKELEKELGKKELEKRLLYDPSSTFSLVRKWGPSTRNIIRSMKFAALELHDPVEEHAERAVIHIWNNRSTIV
jgi:hypothetical protein